MRFRTIWTAPAVSFKERLLRTRDWAALEIGARLPKRIKYWVVLHEVGKATRYSSDVPATPLDEVLKNLDRPSHIA